MLAAHTSIESPTSSTRSRPSAPPPERGLFRARVRFASLLSRFESTLQEARDAREPIVGYFDVLIARGGHRTNEIMKVLTLASVILLPGALIAGVMGMNFKVGSSTQQPLLGRPRRDHPDRTSHDRPRQNLAPDLSY